MTPESARIRQILDALIYTGGIERRRPPVPELFRCLDALDAKLEAAEQERPVVARADAAERRAEQLTEALLNAKRDVLNVGRAAFDSTRAALATAALRRIDEALAAAEGAGDAA